MRKTLIYIVLVVYLISLSFYGYGQDGVPVDQSTFQEIRGEVDFSRTKKIYRPQQKKSTNAIQKIDPLPSADVSAISGVLQMLSYIVLALLLALLLYYIYKSATSRNPDKVIEVTEEPFDIRDLDTDALYKEAMHISNYRLAVRVHFLRVLQLLQDKRWIVWEADKTNRSYARELRDKKPHADFVRLAGHFEAVWYGNKGISRQEFNEIEPLFDSFRRQYG